MVCLEGLAASGGYYVAQAGDTIMAYPTCITGSIGVIAMKFNFRGLMDKVGLDTDVVKTGAWKDFWSPFRAATPKEKEMMQQIIEEFYRDFVNVVAQGRKMSLKEVQQVADGRIFTAPQARDLKLIDKIGYLDDALKEAQALAGISGARIVRYHRPGSLPPQHLLHAPGIGERRAPIPLSLAGRRNLNKSQSCCTSSVGTEAARGNLRIIQALAFKSDKNNRSGHCASGGDRLKFN